MVLRELWRKNQEEQAKKQLNVETILKFPL